MGKKLVGIKPIILASMINDNYFSFAERNFRQDVIVRISTLYPVKIE